MDGGAPENFEGGRWWTTTVLWTVVLFGSFLLNATLLFAFLRRPGLRTISNRFVMNLVASNLLTCVILTPLLMLDAPPASYNLGLCVISEGASAMAMASSVLSVLLIAIDQYFAVVDPLRYRTRIDKLKCGVLIISVWLVSVFVALIAAFNPHPRSLWLSCSDGLSIGDYKLSENMSLINATFDFTVDSTILFDNTSDDYNVEGEFKVTESNGSSTIEKTLEFAENSTLFLGGTFVESFQEANITLPSESLLGYLTYGLAYAVFYSLFIYLIPFVAVCWIYVSIYLAAHKNSERARRTGSGPMLSSSSFCEDYGTGREDLSNDDFRRIPKISSLSSIDESTETSTSQIPRRRSEMMLCTSAIEEEPSTGVVFTVGSQKVNVSPQKPVRSDATKESKVPISALKAEFFGKQEEAKLLDDNIRSRFSDRPDIRRKSSHDILCEEMLRKDLERLRIPEDSSGASSADEDDPEEEEMLTFTKSRRLEDIEVSKCQNSIEDREDYHQIPLLGNSVLSVPADHRGEFRNFGDLRVAVDADSAEPENQVVPTHRPPQLTASSKSSKIVQSSNRSGVIGGILSRAAVENHNAKSRSQNGFHHGVNRSAMNGRYANGIYNRNESALDHVEDIFLKNTSGQNFVESESLGFGHANNAGVAPVVTITPPNKIPLHRVSSIKSTSSYINSLKYRISNASLFKYREETRAARISALVIVMGLICWTPYTAVLILRNLPIVSTSGDNNLPHNYDVAALSFLILAAYVSPLLFGYRSRRVKKELRRIFCFKKTLSYRNNRSLMAKKVLKRRHSSNLSQLEMEAKYNIFSCVYGRNRWPKEKVQFMQVPETALTVETCRSSFSSGASTQISTTSTEEC
ncbi:uncharacterized protein LOC105694057 [Athalia rosae]|uniref:uncharacterized protein LOC105694057 n=1 Tax=Athalia rosae TaxID=37344 RepID=UPI0020337D27|nr:uncharacterized protein LOC105694057 [Athalia rosae]XP_048505153.1 uncharacterized protein LOC105694057 [Athalia rosae]